MRGWGRPRMKRNKDFFFEKKKQKPLIALAAAFQDRARLFFQKRTAFCLGLPPIAGVRD
jgi:hypothetical protein